mmetsp:Transcript_27429/g.72036  ORF Transcript_27429/g.72036 Transcript_27429/m.72036 type:complete len:831 (+) Transcript_27429:69-2561(+)
MMAAVGSTRQRARQRVASSTSAGARDGELVSSSPSRPGPAVPTTATLKHSDPSHGIVELISLILPEDEDDPLREGPDEGPAAVPTVATHTADGRRQRAFETVLAFGFSSVLCSTLLLGLSEAVTVAELKGFIVAISTVVTIISFSATYTFAGKIKYQSEFRLWQPFKGGIRFVMLQATAWVFFAMSLLLPLGPVAAAVIYPKTAVVGFSLCGGVAALLGQVAMMCSLPLFGKHDAADPTSTGRPVPPTLSRGDRQPSTFFVDHGWWRPFIAVQVLVSCAALVLSATSDTLAGPGGLQPNGLAWMMGCIALCCVVLSTTLTHGIGGRWMHSHTEWAFFQPGSGGRRFVRLQGAAWTLFSISVYAFGWRLGMLPEPTSVMGVGTAMAPPSFTVAAAVGAVAQLLNAASLSRFESPPPILRKTTDPNPLGSQPIARMLWVLFVFNVDKMLVLALLLSWGLAPRTPVAVVTTWTAVGLAYIPTYFGSPSKTGRRRVGVGALRWLVEHMVAYFRFELHRVPDAKSLDPKHRYIMGFHPHGIVPVTSSWLTLTRQWAAAFPGIQPALLVSSVIHFVPVFRDLAQLMGSYEVSRVGFETALDNEGAVMLVPGGQAEMLSARSAQPEVVINTSHKGFVRLAMQSAARSAAEGGGGKVFLVPIYSFGENEMLDNVQIPRKLQQWSIKTLRANVLFLPYGSYCAPGFPRRVPATVVTGTPVEVPPVATPSRDQVDALHRLYMHELVAAFEQLKERAGCAGQIITFDPPLEPLSRAQYSALWPTLRARGGSFYRGDRKPQHNFLEGGLVTIFFLTNFVGLVLVAVATYTPCVDDGGWGACR